MGILNSLRVMTTAYLMCEDSVLLMERSPHRGFLPGVWSGVGGHVEPGEYGDLKSACLREIEEETGFRRNDVHTLRLGYVLLRQRHHELRQQFVYFGRVDTTQIGITEEGTLCWIPQKNVLNYQMTDSNRMMLEHYFQNPGTDSVFVGAMHGEDVQAGIGWATVSDWEEN